MTLAYADLAGAITSLAAVQQEINGQVQAILSQPLADAPAFPFSQYWQDGFPYWTNRLVSGRPAAGGSGKDVEPYSILFSLHLGPFTQGSDGVLEQTLFTWVPVTLAYIRGTPMLQSAAYPDAPLGLQESFISFSRVNYGQRISVDFQIDLNFNVDTPERW